jgi:hypothetical protein
MGTQMTEQPPNILVDEEKSRSEQTRLTVAIVFFLLKHTKGKTEE